MQNGADCHEILGMLYDIIYVQCFHFAYTCYIHKLLISYSAGVFTSLTHLPLVPHKCVNELGQHWFR